MIDPSSLATARQGTLAPTKELLVPKRPFWTTLKLNWMYYAMLVPATVLMALFSFYPMWGIVMAFMEYSPYKGFQGSPWVGLAQFRRILTMPNAGPIFRNTVLIAVGKIISGQMASLTFALLLHQVANRYFKRTVQTVTTFPHFLSWVVVGGIILRVLSSEGLINSLLGKVGIGPIRFLTDPRIFPLTLIGTETWKEFGFGAVIYLAALTAINPELYEAAAVDGAGRWGRLWAVTLPGIRSTVVLMLCLSLGNILSAGFEQILILENPLVYSTGDVIDTFVYRAGVLEAQYSLATALGLLRSAIGCLLILASYWLADRFADYRIF